MLKPPAGGGQWGFEHRAYYPPPDLGNALLSFGCTLLLNNLIAACQMIGLDPYLGFFPVIDYRRPSLALDLVNRSTTPRISPVPHSNTSRTMPNFYPGGKSRAGKQGNSNKCGAPANFLLRIANTAPSICVSVGLGVLPFQPIS